ncbi:MAG TPA: phosphate ABC transporter permease PstA [Thermodesulfobacteriota bacterium]
MRSTAVYRRRRLVNVVTLSASALTMAFALAFLAWVLGTLFAYGFGGLSTRVFTEMTPPPGSSGGLLNAIAGSAALVAIGIAIGAPVGVLAGTYLAEFGARSWLAWAARFINDVLLSAPSIIIGLFVYTLLVVPVKHFSGWAGAVSLAIIALPVVVRTTEDMLRLVPASLREAAAALGAPRWKVVVLVAYRAARAGIITGVMLAVARVSGETAPLLFTALNNQFWSMELSRPVANLPVTIFQYAMSPYEDWHALAWAGALLITLGVLALNISARSLFHQRRGGE